MTNDPRGAAMTSYTVRVHCAVDFEIVEDVLAHSEQDALDSIDEDVISENLAHEYEGVFSNIKHLGVLEATIVEINED